MKILIFLVGALFSNYAIAMVFTCYYGTYNFNGTYYSDSYAPKTISTLDACNDKLLTAEGSVVHANFIANRELIKTAINSILNDKACDSVKDVVQKYIDDLKKIDDKVAERSVGIQETVKFVLAHPGFEVQAQTAFVAQYNAACAFEDHRLISMVDAEDINYLMMQKLDPAPTNITTSGSNAEDCRNVSAGGAEDVSDFTISMKNGTQNFTFTFDPYSVPDQVIITNSKGKSLYDSGCVGNSANGVTPISLTLDAPQNSKLHIKIKHNCEERANGSSVWDFTLKCQTPPSNICKPQFNNLVDLLKKEAEYLKKILDHYDLERQCYLSYGATVAETLAKGGIYVTDNSGSPTTLGMCTSTDPEISKKLGAQQKQDLENSKAIGASTTNLAGTHILPSPVRPNNAINSSTTNLNMVTGDLSPTDLAIKNLKDKKKAELLALQNSVQLGLIPTANLEENKKTIEGLGKTQNATNTTFANENHETGVLIINNGNENSLEAQPANATSSQTSSSSEREIGKHKTVHENNLELRKNCDCDPDDESTIFERISWSYLNVGFKRLGL